MDIQKKPTLAEKQTFWAEQLPNFESKYWLPSHFEFLAFDMDHGNYVIKDDLDPRLEDDANEIFHRVNTGWAMWKKAVNFTVNAQLRAESDRYFNETQVLDTELCRVNRENNMLCGDLQKLKRELEMGNFFDRCNKERWKYQDKYAYHFKLNLLLICMIFIGLILWVLI